MWTKSQKMSAGLLGVAVLAFGVDRWVLSPSGDANTAGAASEYAVGTSGASNATAPTKPADATTPTTPVVTLANRLSELAAARRFQYMTSPDAFLASEDSRAQAKEKTATKDGSSTDTASSDGPAVARSAPGHEFSRRHSLSAIMNAKTGGMAIVDGKLYPVGTVIDGFKLTKVGTTDVTFTGNGGDVTLKLPGQFPIARIEE